MNIIWLSWKDIHHPQAGGAELVTDQLCRRAAADGHKVTIITSRPKGAAASENINGYKVLRAGNRYTVYWHAWRTYRRQPKPDIVIEEVNTVPFFARFYTRGTRRIMLFHQLSRQIWFYEFFKPLALIGYWAEPIYLRIARSNQVIAMSPSTKADLQKYGYHNSDIQIISEGIAITPIKSLSKVKKDARPSIIAYGSMRPMKRTMHVLRAFEKAKPQLPDLRLTIAGRSNSDYGQSVLRAAKDSQYAGDITIVDSPSQADLLPLLRSHHYIVAAAVKEGWGLTITEAASQGTPAIAYDIDGQRDAVFGGQAGLLVRPDTNSLAAAMVRAFGKDTDYPALQKAAWDMSKQINFDNSHKDFLRVIGD